jgi:hypothetical protein
MEEFEDELPDEAYEYEVAAAIRDALNKEK